MRGNQKGELGLKRAVVTGKCWILHCQITLQSWADHLPPPGPQFPFVKWKAQWLSDHGCFCEDGQWFRVHCQEVYPFIPAENDLCAFYVPAPHALVPASAGPSHCLFCSKPPSVTPCHCHSFLLSTYQHCFHIYLLGYRFSSRLHEGRDLCLFPPGIPHT